jgi:septal ring factor EnvC (AmiA/AmiB activator)
MPPRLALVLRRTFVTAGVLGTLVLGAATVRAAAIWTASAAPMEAPPISPADIAARLNDAAARSAALDQQIADLTKQTMDLATALAKAEKRIGTDSTTARALRAELAAAEKKLAALSRALKGSASHTKPGANPTAPEPKETPEPTEHEADD